LKKKDIRKKGTSASMKRIQILIVFILIVLALHTIAIRGILSKHLKDYAFETFEKRSTEKHIYLKEMLNHRWTVIDSYVKQTVAELEGQLSDSNRSKNENKINVQITNQLMTAALDNMIELLRTSGSTEVFFILSKDFSSNKKMDQQAGFLISRKEPHSYKTNNQDLLLEVGSLQINKEMNLNRSENWRKQIPIQADSNYYHKPVNAAIAGKTTDQSRYAYWGCGKLPHIKEQVLTYSMPIITSAGQTIGVIGIGIRESSLEKMMLPGESQDGFYLLCRSKDGHQYEPLIATKTGKELENLSLGEHFLMQPDYDGIMQIYQKDNKATGLCASGNVLYQYKQESPFAPEIWEILEIQKKASLLHDDQSITDILTWLAAMLCLCLAGGLYWLQRISKLPVNIETTSARDAEQCTKVLDPLTGILNRKTFEDKMRELFATPNQLKSAVLAVWDLDNLKYVNDTYGHPIGDEYILAFADCMRKFQKENVFFARRSGDEFITFIYGRTSKKELDMLVQELWDIIRTTNITLPNGEVFRLRASGGIAWYPDDAVKYEDLFSYADFAMYTVKHHRKGTVQAFEPKLYQANKILLQGQEAFNNLLDRQLVSFMIQPIITAQDGKIYGYEMLMRSNVDIFKSPSDILRVAESQSKLYDMELLTWFEAMKTFVEQIKRKVIQADSHVFINSIANQKLQPDMLEAFQTIYADYLSQIVCEFTEEQQVDLEYTKDKQQIMRQWGALTALDDYGGGYNSESILLEITPDIIKIDRNLVKGIDVDDSRKQLVKNLVAYAKERNILILGEGVETKEEFHALLALDVDLLQGYYIGRPTYEGGWSEEKVCQEIKQRVSHKL
jgi:diguanylate cyclase (GGDEF)-like protein